MLTKTPSWTTTDGKVHTNYLTGLKHELTTMFTKSAENEVISKKIVESFNVDNIDRVVELLTTIKSELKEPSQFEVNMIPKPAVTGIEDKLPNISLGIVGNQAQEPEPPLELDGGQAPDEVETNDVVPDVTSSTVQHLDPPIRTFVDPGYDQAQRAAA